FHRCFSVISTSDAGVVTAPGAASRQSPNAQPVMNSLDLDGIKRVLKLCDEGFQFDGEVFDLDLLDNHRPSPAAATMTEEDVKRAEALIAESKAEAEVYRQMAKEACQHAMALRAIDEISRGSFWRLLFRIRSFF